MRYRIVLIHQPGMVPSLIRWLTRSRWNHVGLIDDDGVIRDLDWRGPGSFRIEDRPSWQFLVLDHLTVTCSWIEFTHQHFVYSIWQNLNWMFARLGTSFSMYERTALKRNCVGLVADVFRRPDWAGLAPGDFERMATHGIS